MMTDREFIRMRLDEGGLTPAVSHNPTGEGSLLGRLIAGIVRGTANRGLRQGAAQRTLDTAPAGRDGEEGTCKAA